MRKKKKNTHGGKRAGAGRKSEDPKKQVTTYVKESELKTFGEELPLIVQRQKCRAFFQESLAQRTRSLSR